MPNPRRRWAVVDILLDPWKSQDESWYIYRSTRQECCRTGTWAPGVLLARNNHEAQPICKRYLPGANGTCEVNH
jgi:hypothetical protein